jgi:hypothetical protein
VAISLAPGKKIVGAFVHWDRDLETDLNRLKELGVTTLIPFLTDDELKRLKIPNLVEAAAERGFAVLRFPFRDVGIPGNMAEAVQFVKDVIQSKGQFIAGILLCQVASAEARAHTEEGSANGLAAHLHS